MSATTSFQFDNTYARDLEGLYALCRPASAPSPRLLFLNHDLADELQLDSAALNTPEGAAIFAGSTVPEGAQPLAQIYAGHQFGHFSRQLGDGRALLLGEVMDRHGRRRDIALKGSGATPFSRGGDGKAAVGPMLREALVSEGMHALGIPTTRAFAVAATGEPVYRERVMPGAVLTRVAASHLRVGTFEFFSSRRDIDRLRQLADYAIRRHDPDLAGAPERFLGLLRRVAARQAALIAQWVNVGFIHGVMNTDNMTISGETIDYGPCAFMEACDPQAVFSSIDEGGRYAYSRQPQIAQWNLARFGEALVPLMLEGATEATMDEAIDEAIGLATEVINAVPGLYQSALLAGQRAKLGLALATADQEAEDAALVDGWLSLLHKHQVDFTLAWRRLADAAAGDEAPLRGLFKGDAQAPDAWLGRWRSRCASEDGGSSASPSAGTARAARMRQINPWVIPRNHLVEEALAAASNEEDIAPFARMLEALRRPYEETMQNARYGEPAPPAVTACYQTFCGT